MKFLKEYWPLLAVMAWFGYKWWAGQRLVARLLLKKNGYTQVHNIGVWRNFLRHGLGA